MSARCSGTNTLDQPPAEEGITELSQVTKTASERRGRQVLAHSTLSALSESVSRTPLKAPCGAAAFAGAKEKGHFQYGIFLHKRSLGSEVVRCQNARWALRPWHMRLHAGAAFLRRIPARPRRR
jgi:hypothetical protein